MAIRFVFFALLAVESSPDNVVVRCAEDSRAVRIVDRMADLPAEIREDIVRATNGFIGERPRLLRRSHVLIPEESDHLNIRFYRAVQFEHKWYLQIEHALMSGVQTLGYYLQNGRRYVRSVGDLFSGPPCETIRAALSGVSSSPMYLGR